MNRRELINLMAAAVPALMIPKMLGAELPSADPVWMREFKRTGRLVRKDIVLHKPFVLSGELGVIEIRNCSFRAADDFVGETMIVVKKGTRGSVCSNALVPPNSEKGLKCLKGVS